MTPEEMAKENARKGIISGVNKMPIPADNSDLFMSPEDKEKLRKSLTDSVEEKRNMFNMMPAPHKFIANKLGMATDVMQTPAFQKLANMDIIEKPIDKPKLFEAMRQDNGELVPAAPDTKMETVPPVPVKPPTIEKKVQKSVYDPVPNPMEMAKAQKSPEAVVSQLKGEVKKGSGIGEKIKALALQFGVPILSIIEAGAKGYAHNDSNLSANTIMAEKYKEKENEYLAGLARERGISDEARARNEAEADQKRWEQRFGITEAAEKEARKADYAQQDKIAAMRAAGEQAVSAPMSVDKYYFGDE